MSTQVGSAHVAVRAVAKDVKKDLDKAFKDVLKDKNTFRKFGEDAGDQFDKAFSKKLDDSFRKAVSDSSSTTGASGKRTGKTFGDLFANEASKSIRAGYARIGRDLIKQSRADGEKAGSAYAKSFITSATRDINQNASKLGDQLERRMAVYGSQAGNAYGTRFSRSAATSVQSGHREIGDRLSRQSAQHGRVAGEAYGRQFSRAASRQGAATTLAPTVNKAAIAETVEATQAVSRAANRAAASASNLGDMNLGGLKIASITALTSGATAATGALNGMIHSLSQVIGMASAGAPAALAGLVSTFAAVKVATFGMGDAFKAAFTEGEEGATAFNEAIQKLTPSAAQFVTSLRDIRGELSVIQDLTQESFFSEFADSFDSMLSNQLVNVKNGMSQVAGGAGSVVNGIMSALSTDRSADQMANVFAKIAEGLRLGETAAYRFTSALLTLTSAGANYMPRLSVAIGNVATTFDNFMTRVTSDGSFDRFMERGIESSKQWGRILSDLGSSISSIFRGGSEHTRAFMDSMEGATQSMADFLKSAEGQEKIAGFFDAAHEAMRAWSPIIKDIAGALADILPIVHDFSIGFLSALRPVTALLDRFGPQIGSIAAAFLAWKTIGSITSLAAAGLGKFGIALGGLGAKAGAANAAVASTAATAGAARGRFGALGLAAASAAPAMTRLGTAFQSVNRPMTDLSRSISTNAAGMGRLSQAAAAPAGALARLGGIAGGTAKAGFTGAKMAAGGLVGALGGPFGLALTGAVVGLTDVASSAMRTGDAIKNLSELTQQQAQNMQAFSDTLTMNKGALNPDNITQSQDIVRAELEKTAVSTEKSGGIIKGIFNGLDEVFNTSYKTQVENIDKGATAWDRNRAAGQAAKMEQEALNNVLRDTGMTQDDVTRAVANGGPAFANLISNLRASGDEGIAYANRLQDIRREIEGISAMSSGASTLERYSAAMKLMGDNTGDATAQLSIFKTALDIATGSNVSADLAISQHAQSIQGLAQEMGGLGNNVFDLKGNLDATNPAFAGLIQGIDQSRDSLFNQITAMDKSGASFGDMTSKISASKQALIDQAVSMGITGDQAQKLADKVYGIPSQTVMSVTAPDLATTMQELTELGLKVESTDGKSISIDANDENARAILDKLGYDYEEINGKFVITTEGLAEAQAARDGLSQPIESFMSWWVDNAAPEQARAENEMPVMGLLNNNVDNSKPEAARNANLLPMAGHLDNNVDNSKPEAARARNERPSSSTHTITVEERVTRYISSIRANKTTSTSGTEVGHHYGGATGGFFSGTGFKRYASGGRHKGYQLPDSGPGTEITDGFVAFDKNGKPIAQLDANEWVINGEASKKYDKELELINKGVFPKLPGFAAGGQIGNPLDGATGILGSGLDSLVATFVSRFGSAIDTLATKFSAIQPGAATAAASAAAPIGQASAAQGQNAGSPLAGTADEIAQSGSMITDTVGQQISPALTALDEQLRVTKTEGIDPTFNGITSGMMGIGVTVPTVANSQINPAMTAMGTNTMNVATSMFNPAMQGVQATAATTGNVFGVVTQDSMIPNWYSAADAVMGGYVGTIDPAFQGVMGGINTVGASFANGANYITDQWGRIREAAAAPVRFVIGTVFNDGIVGMWNSVSELLGTDKINPYPIAFATGGYVSGPGGPTDDKVPAVLSNGEYVMTADAVNRVGQRNLDALNYGDVYVETNSFNDPKRRDQLMQDATFKQIAAKYAGGGPVKGDHAWNQIKRGMDWARSRNGRPYVLGGSADGGGGTDCSGYMSGIADVIGGGSGARQWATMSFNGGGNAQQPNGPQGFVAGLEAGFSVGVLNGGPAGGHTAGTIGGLEGLPATNVESGGSHGNVAFGGPAVGADHSQFPTKYHLPNVGGRFISGGGGGGPSIYSIIEGAIAEHWDPVQKKVDASNFPGTLGSIVKPSAKSLKAAFDEKIGKIMETMGGDPGGNGAERWRPMLIRAMKAQGMDAWANDPAIVDKFIRQIQTESGGDPNISQQIVDSNGTGDAAGVGLGQIIPTTWAASRDPSLPDDRRNPWAHLNAMVRYVRDNNKINVIGNGHGYDKGGVLPPTPGGFGTYYNHTGKPEAVLTNDQWIDFSKMVVNTARLLEPMREMARDTSNTYGVLKELKNTQDPNQGKGLSGRDWMGWKPLDLNQSLVKTAGWNLLVAQRVANGQMDRNGDPAAEAIYEVFGHGPIDAANIERMFNNAVQRGADAINKKIKDTQDFIAAAQNLGGASVVAAGNMGQVAQNALFTFNPAASTAYEEAIRRIEVQEAEIAEKEEAAKAAEEEKNNDNADKLAAAASDLKNSSGDLKDSAAESKTAASTTKSALTSATSAGLNSKYIAKSAKSGTSSYSKSLSTQSEEEDKGPTRWDQLMGMVHRQDYTGALNFAAETLRADPRSINPEGYDEWEQTNTQAIQDWKRDAIKEIGGQFAAPFGLESRYEAEVDKEYERQMEIAAEVAAQTAVKIILDERVKRGDEGAGKIADTMIVNGANEEELAAKIRREQQAQIQAGLSRFRG